MSSALTGRLLDDDLKEVPVTAEGRAWEIVLVLDDREVVVGRIVDARPDMTWVDTLARLQLAARRGGFSIRLRGPCRELSELLDLAGLTDVVVAEPNPLTDEAGGQAESLE